MELCFISWPREELAVGGLCIKSKELVVGISWGFGRYVSIKVMKCLWGGEFDAENVEENESYSNKTEHAGSISKKCKIQHRTTSHPTNTVTPSLNEW